MTDPDVPAVAEVPAERFPRQTLLRRAAAVGLSLSGAAALARSGAAAVPANVSKLLSGVKTIHFLKGPWVANEPAFVQKTIQPFYKKFPNIKVQEVEYQWSTREVDLTKAFASPSVPDVTYFSAMYWVRFAALGALQPLDTLIKDADFRPIWNTIPPKLQKSGSYKGHVYAIPFVTDLGTAQMVNLDLLKKAGVKDWSSSLQAVRAAAEAVKRKTGAWGFGMEATFADGSWQNILAFIQNAGASVYNSDLTQAGLNTPNVVKTFNLLRDMWVVDKSAPGPGLYNAQGLDGLWRAGKLAIYNVYSPQPPQLQGVKFNFAVLPVPGIFPHKYGSYLDIGHLAMSAKSQHQTEAWDFIKYESSQQGLYPWEKALGFFYPGARSNEAAVFNTKDPFQRVYKQAYKDIVLKYAQPSPAEPHLGAVTKVISDQFQAMASGSQTAAQTTKNMQDQINTILKQPA